MAEARSHQLAIAGQPSTQAQGGPDPGWAGVSSHLSSEAPEGQPSSGPAGPSSSARPAPPAPGPRALSTTGPYFSGGASGPAAGSYAAQSLPTLRSLIAHLGPTHQRPEAHSTGSRSREAGPRGCREPQQAWQRPAWASKGPVHQRAEAQGSPRPGGQEQLPLGHFPTQLEGAGLAGLATGGRLALIRAQDTAAPGGPSRQPAWARAAAALAAEALVLEQRRGASAPTRATRELYEICPRLRGFGTNISPEDASFSSA